MTAKRSKPTYGRLLRLFDIGAFFRWWSEGLALWLPNSLRRKLTPAPTSLVVRPYADEVVVSEEKGEQSRELGRFPRSALAEGRAVLPRPGNRRIVLRLGAEDTLSRETTLPMAAENNLRQVVGFEIDRLTPFPPDKLHYDVQVVQRMAAERTLRVRFTVILRDAMDQFLNQLNVIGVAPDVVDVAGAGALNLLPPRMRPRKGRAARGIRSLLWILIAVTIGVAAVVPLWQQRNVIVDLIPRVDAAQQEAESVVSLRARLENAVESSQFLLQKRYASVPVIELMNELTTILPDNTWVEQFIIKGNEVQVRGQSRDAAGLIAIVEASEYFEQATFRSPVTPDRRTGADRFFLTTQIAKNQPSADSS